MNQKIENQNPRYCTPKQLVKMEPSFSLGAIRWAIFNSKTNGLEEAIVRVGKKVLIDRERFYYWIERHRANKGSDGL
jgi:hypothetical protein